MSIHWGSLLAVFVVSLGSAVAVVALVTLGLVGLAGLSGPAAPTAWTGRAEIGVPNRPWALPAPSCRATLALLSLAAAAAIVLLGLWVILDK
jgi:hypothetical protein